MNIFIVYAHPEEHSLNRSLLNFAVEHLKSTGHSVEVSNLYEMKWNSTLEPGSIPSFINGTQAADITEEQRKLRWADVVIFQFPMWWYSMPAILKRLVRPRVRQGLRLRSRRTFKQALGLALR